MKAFLLYTVTFNRARQSAVVFFSLCFLGFGWLSFADTNDASGKNIFQDADQDGLSNDEERLYGTDPHRADTDSDGYSDGTEVRSGYDPKKPAPNDKIFIGSTNTDAFAKKQTLNEEGGNLTQEVSKQVATAFKESAAHQEKLSLDDLRATIEKAMTDGAKPESLPEIDREKITIKKQKYSDLSEEERKIKIKEDVNEYVSAVSYILASNSPVPMRSDSDMTALTSFATSNMRDLLLGNNPALLSELAQKGESISEQLYGMTVPENMIETHIKGIKLTQYAIALKDDVGSKGGSDPLAQISALSKVQGFMTLFADFTTEIQNILTKNDIADKVTATMENLSNE